MKVRKNSAAKYRRGSRASSRIAKSGVVTKMSNANSKKKTETPTTRSRRRLSKTKVKTKENVPDNKKSDVRKDANIYDFDQSDEDGLKQVLFPDQNEENKVKGSKQYTSSSRKRKATATVGTENKAKVAKRDISTDIKVKPEKKKRNTQVTGLKKADYTKTSKGDKEIKHRPLREANIKQLKSRRGDSGVLATPMLRLSTQNYTEMDTGKSTPIQNEPTIMPSPMLSPVEKMSPINFSPKKHQQLDKVVEASSPNFKSPRPVDRSYSGRGSIGRSPISPALIKEVRKSSKSKKPSKNERRQSSKYEDWAVRMSLELEEAESYELSVED